jgi:hypothetical protein
MAINMPRLISPIWKKKAVILKRTEFQILPVMFATWLEGLICLPEATTAVVGRGKKENILRFKLGKKKRNSSMSNNSDSTSISIDQEGCSIPEVMTELHSIEGVHIGDDFHRFATEFLGLRRNREMWSTMGNIENKMK